MTIDDLAAFPISVRAAATRRLPLSARRRPVPRVPARRPVGGHGEQPTPFFPGVLLVGFVLTARAIMRPLE